ncbi:hypothetical protein PTKIN_Ptkin10aG0105700 [Pterospermum kingtungense]
MAGSSLVYVMIVALLFSFGAAQSPSEAPANAPESHAPKHAEHPPAHAPKHGEHPPAHAPSPHTRSSISQPPSHAHTPAPAPAPGSSHNASAAVFNTFSPAMSVAVGVFAAVLVM